MACSRELTPAQDLSSLKFSTYGTRTLSTESLWAGGRRAQLACSSIPRMEAMYLLMMMYGSKT